MTAPVITASLTQNNMDVTIPVLVTNNVVPILDNFNRANSATTLNPASDGGTWSVDFGGVFGIAGNTAYNISAVVGVGPSSGPSVAIARRDVGQAVMEFVVDITRSSTAGGSVLVACYDPITTSCYEVIYDSSSSFGSLNRIASDGHPGLGVSVFFTAWTGGTTSLKLSRDAGGVVTISQLVSGSWVSKGTFTDTFPLTGTWAGFGTAPTSPGADNWDNFTVTPPSGSTGPYTYTIDYDDGITDSFTTTLSTHTFTHTYLNTTPKTIKVQAYSLLPSAFNVASTGTAAHSTTVAVFVNNTVQVGDLLIFAAAGYGSSGITVDPAGWNRIGVTTGTADIPIDLGLWWRIATSVDPGVTSSPATFPNNDYHVGVILAYSGYGAVRSSALVGGSVAAGSSITTPTLSAISGDAVISVWAGEGDTGVAPGFTIDAADTFRADVSLSFPRLMLGDEPATGGTTSARTVAVSGGGVVSWAAAQVAISPTPINLYSNIVLLYPVWVTGSAVNNSTRTAFI